MALAIELAPDQVKHAKPLNEILERLPEFEEACFQIMLGTYSKTKQDYITKRTDIILDEAEGLAMLVDYLCDFLDAKCSLDMSFLPKSKRLIVKIGNVRNAVC